MKTLLLQTHEKSWKPPRRTARCSTEGTWTSRFVLTTRIKEFITLSFIRKRIQVFIVQHVISQCFKFFMYRPLCSNIPRPLLWQVLRSAWGGHSGARGEHLWEEGFWDPRHNRYCPGFIVEHFSSKCISADARHKVQLARKKSRGTGNFALLPA